MDTRLRIRTNVSVYSSFFLGAITCFVLSACGVATQGTPSATTIPLPTITLAPQNETPVPLPPPLPTSTSTCSANLLFLKDVTIPDGTVVAPGSSLDKQWLVENNGDCNWDDRFRLRLISGDALGAVLEQALFPARAGAQANIRIIFTAPQEPGNYISEWQAFDEKGIPFGDSFFIKIVVQL